jgi:hypothetical protein
MRHRLPFPLLGIDSDSGGEFINFHLYNYCQDEKITFTRARPYKKTIGHTSSRGTGLWFARSSDMLVMKVLKP